MKKKIAFAVIFISSLIGGPVYSSVTMLRPVVKEPEIEIAYGSTDKEVKEQIAEKAQNFKDIEVLADNIPTEQLGKQELAVNFSNYLGRESQKNVTIAVVDKEKPVIEMPDTITVEAGETIDLSEQIKITDNVPQEPNVTFSDFQVAKPEVQSVMVSAQDESGNQASRLFELVVRDTKAPVLTVEPVTITQGSPFAPLDKVVAKDQVEGNVTAKVVVKGQVDTQKLGTQVLHYEVADASGNVAKKERKVTVVAPTVAETPVETPAPAEEQPVVAATQAPANKPSYPANSLLINGMTIAYQNAGPGSGQGVIDANHSMVATWGGSALQSGDDNLNTHFIGHNPGIFSVLFSVGMGNQIVVTDGLGRPTTYQVNGIFQVDDYAVGVADGVDYSDTILGTGGGERITLQTCVNDDINLIVLASKA